MARVLEQRYVALLRTDCANLLAYLRLNEGPGWPAGGEIDIVEGVNDYTNNQATIHTNAGCNLANTNGFSGTLVGGTNCAALQTGNQGCGIRAVQTNSYGAPFNANGGGVYASKLLISFAECLRVLITSCSSSEMG